MTFYMSKNLLLSQNKMSIMRSKWPRQRDWMTGCNFPLENKNEKKNLH